MSCISGQKRGAKGGAGSGWPPRWTSEWGWLAREALTRQILAFPAGERRRQSAQALGEKIPTGDQAQALFYPDQYAVDKRVLPSAQPRAITTRARKTTHVAGFNGTLRQRGSRLVRAT
jgi:IS1 family transposase